MARVLILFRKGRKLRIEYGDPLVQFAPLHANVGDEPAHSSAEPLLVWFVQQNAESFFEMTLALGNNNPALEKNAGA